MAATLCFGLLASARLPAASAGARDRKRFVYEAAPAAVPIAGRSDGQAAGSAQSMQRAGSLNQRTASQ